MLHYWQMLSSSILALRRWHGSWQLAIFAGFALASCWVALSFVLIIRQSNPPQIMYDYSAQRCFRNPTLFPGLVTQTNSQVFTAGYRDAVKLGKLSLFATTTCVSPIDPPTSGQAAILQLRYFGLSWLHQNLRVGVQDLPTLAYDADANQPISTSRHISFKLSGTDQINRYIILANQKQVECQTSNRTVSCNLAGLNLSQSSRYALVVKRTFRSIELGTVFQKTFATIADIHITASSIADGQTVYDQPSSLSLTINRPATTAGEVKLHEITNGVVTQTVTTNTTLNQTHIQVTWDQALKRSRQYLFEIRGTSANDGGQLDGSYKVRFNTSGGPKVTSTNLGSYKISTSTKALIHFDTDLRANQDFRQFIELSANGSVLGATATLSHSTMTVSATSNLPRCTTILLKVRPGLISAAGVGQGEAWQTSFRTICQTVYSIGTSVQGRSITAYRFGTGSSVVMYVGNLHGNEKSSVATLNHWVDYLERNSDRLPANRSIIVIPSTNPDGYAANRRTNSHNVDLNRNFPSTNWTSNVMESPTNQLAGGGGSQPLSEPEAQSLASYIQFIRPRLVLSYHAIGGMVLGNDAADSTQLAHQYDAASNVGYLDGSSSSQFFDYTVTGALESWLYDTLKLPTLVVELRTQTGDEFSGHQKAMWNMASL